MTPTESQRAFLGLWRVHLFLVLAAVVQGIAVAKVGPVAVAPTIAVLVAVAAMKRPVSMVAALIVYLPLEGFFLRLMPGGAVAYFMVIPEAVLGVAAISALTFQWKRGQRTLSWWFLVVVSISVLGMISAFYNATGLLLGLYWLRLIVRYSTAAIIVALGTLSDFKSTLEKLFKATAASAVIQFVPSVLEFLLGMPASSFFLPASVSYGGASVLTYNAKAIVHGTMGFYNNLGVFTAICLAFSVSAFIATPREDVRLRRWYGAGAVAAGLCTALSQSRQGALAAMMVVVVLIATQARERRAKILAWGTTGLVVVAVLAPLFPSIPRLLTALTGRFSEAFTSDYIAASLESDRLFAMFKAVPLVLSKYPLLGLGPGATSGRSSFLQLPTIQGVAGYASNPLAYIQDVGWAGLLVQLGIGGGIWFLVVTLSAARGVRGIHGKANDGGIHGAVLGTVVAVWVAMFASFPLFVRGSSLLLWVALGLALGAATLVSESGPAVDVADSGEDESDAP